MNEELKLIEKKRLPLNHSGAIKALAFILAVVTEIA